jgi:hypothetical protein
MPLFKEYKQEVEDDQGIQAMLQTALSIADIICCGLTSL